MRVLGADVSSQRRGLEAGDRGCVCYEEIEGVYIPIERVVVLP